MAWSAANLKHLFSVIRRGRNPAATVYDSLGPDFFLAPAPGWLNLGLWEGPGTEDEAEAACRRLVATVARHLPAGGTVVDVGNGLGAQDPVIAEVARPTRLVAVNITESQLVAGRNRLGAAGAQPVVADAVRLPLADGSADGVISIEAAFHFRSRPAFFREARRLLRPGGVLAFSDITTERWPRAPTEILAAGVNVRAWGLRMSAAVAAGELARQLGAAGFGDVVVDRVGERVFDQAFTLFRGRLDSAAGRSQPLHGPARILLSQMELLWRRHLVEYVLVRAALR
ncbi:MAG TPA: methyltransferase domain-containing protein [Actinomycetota bacterium]|jgi:SAM-dependent methyltransferase|nr:methyltransferase domain-containing protein [Actinomycetota bacterium]